MTINEYLASLLKSQSLSTEQLDALEVHREEVEGILRKKFGDTPTIRYAGSKAKHTMIAESYDLDIVCYFPHDTERALKEIYEDVYSALSEHYLLERKASAIRIKKVENGEAETDYHIDVVPGRYIDGDSGDVFLHLNDPDKERIQTNIDTHVKFVSESGCREVIKLFKLWKVRNRVAFKTFVLEIFVVQALKGSRSKDNLEQSFVTVIEKLSSDIREISLEDPANSNNIVTDTVTDSDKNTIAAKATDALAMLKDGSRVEIDRWKKVFDEPVYKEKDIGPVVITNPSKPWARE